MDQNWRHQLKSNALLPKNSDLLILQSIAASDNSKTICQFRLFENNHISYSDSTCSGTNLLLVTYYQIESVGRPWFRSQLLPGWGISEKS